MSGGAREKPKAVRALPLVVELDGGLLAVDTAGERKAAAIFRHPLEAETLPMREEVVAWLLAEKSRGRPIHLSASDETIGRQVAGRLELFDGVIAAGAGDRGEALAQAFPGGFTYLAGRRADLPVWRRAAEAVVAGAPSLARRVGATKPLQHAIPAESASARGWLKALRPHQWSKNLLVLAPVALGLHQLTGAGLLRALAAMVLLCAAASLTYLINDAADLAADRRHWSKRRRPLASGAVPVAPALAVAATGLPLVLALGWLVAPAVAAVLAVYVVTTLAYSFGLKAVPLADVLVIGGLFTLRLILGVAAASLLFSAWLLTFGAFFFGALALAKRHTEILRADPDLAGPLPGRGYHVQDAGLTLALGVSSSLASVLIIVLYLVEEVFPRGAYAHPVWLWAAPPILFLWIGRVWLLAQRGRMEDDPVVFALKDPVSWGLGAALGVAFLLALV